MPIITMGVRGLEAFIVSVETDISRGLYQFDIVGLGDKTVSESKSRILAALKNSGFKSPKTAQQKITVLLSPAGIKKEGSHFDLPVAISYLQKSGLLHAGNISKTAIVGELSLTAALQPVKNILLMTLKAKEVGCKNIILPLENADDASLVDGINIVPVKKLSEVVDILSDKKKFKDAVLKNSHEHGSNKSMLANETGELTKTRKRKDFNIDLIIGQENAKRALEIALAGKHNIAFYGPPGIGKSLIAKSVTEILPPLTREEEVECRIIQGNIAGNSNSAAPSNSTKNIFEPPFRDPHHTCTHSSILGSSQSLNGKLSRHCASHLKMDT